jgi:NitT/TauT family transport system substrate-binding protein
MSHLFSDFNRRQFIKYGSMTVGSGILAACTNTNQQSPQPSTDGKLDKINFGLNWVAEAEYGGYYQAVATGIYKDYNLDVTVKQGGPRINVGLLLMTGGIDLAVGDGFEAIKAVETNLPKITVASIFQKTPQVLLAHPGTGINSIQQLKNKSILLGSTNVATYWPLLKVKFGFTDKQLRAYNFDVTPFLADKNLIQQGLLTSEPFTIKQKGGFDPVVMLLADAGYNPYTFTIETTKRLVETKPDLVQRFVDASIKGWYSYLKNPSPGNALIKKDNPEMTDELLSYSLEKLAERGIIISGEAQTQGIGAMTDLAWKIFFDDMVEAGVYKRDINYKEAYTLQFVNKGVGYYKS